MATETTNAHSTPPHTHREPHEAGPQATAQRSSVTKRRGAAPPPRSCHCRPSDVCKVPTGRKLRKPSTAWPASHHGTAAGLGTSLPSGLCETSFTYSKIKLRTLRRAIPTFKCGTTLVPTLLEGRRPIRTQVVSEPQGCIRRTGRTRGGGLALRGRASDLATSTYQD